MAIHAPKADGLIATRDALAAIPVSPTYAEVVADCAVPILRGTSSLTSDVIFQTTITTCVNHTAATSAGDATAGSATVHFVYYAFIFSWKTAIVAPMTAPSHRKVCKAHDHLNTQPTLHTTEQSHPCSWKCSGEQFRLLRGLKRIIVCALFHVI